MEQPGIPLRKTEYEALLCLRAYLHTPSTVGQLCRHAYNPDAEDANYSLQQDTRGISLSHSGKLMSWHEKSDGGIRVGLS